MNSEKAVFKGLKWLFSFFVGAMGIAIVGLGILAVIFNFPSVTREITMASMDMDSLPLGKFTLAIFSSPLFLLLLITNVILYGLLFYFVRSFFKNLEMEEIFVKTNVLTAKKISVVLVLLSVTTCLPEVYASMHGMAMDYSLLDLTYIVGAIIVWALAKILEKANVIAEENELTI